MAIYVAFTWLLVAYGRCEGAKWTESLLVSCAIGVGVSWFFMEPVWIVLVVCLPCVFRNKYMDWLNTRMNDLGLDLSMFIG